MTKIQHFLQYPQNVEVKKLKHYLFLFNLYEKALKYRYNDLISHLMRHEMIITYYFEMKVIEELIPDEPSTK